MCMQHTYPILRIVRERDKAKKVCEKKNKNLDEGLVDSDM